MQKQILTVFALAACAILASAALALAGTIRGTQSDDTITGTPQADTIIAKKGNDTIDAGLGDDRVNAGPGNDDVLGNDGNDNLAGKRGTDDIDGGNGNDHVTGGQSADTLAGGAGDDVVRGRGDGNTADQIACGDGIDTAIADRNDVVAADCETVFRNGNGKAKGPKKSLPAHPVNPVK